MRTAVPEKTLEHWVSQYITYRFRSNASLWWPTRGVDVDLYAPATLPGKLVTFEIKTAYYAPSRPHVQQVQVDLGQLWDYQNRPFGKQPFYVFPLPDWRGTWGAPASRRGSTRPSWPSPAAETGGGSPTGW